MSTRTPTHNRGELNIGRKHMSYVGAKVGCSHSVGWTHVLAIQSPTQGSLATELANYAQKHEHSQVVLCMRLC